MKKIRTAIIGASGYTGVELIRILLNHENAEIVSLAANSNAGQAMSEIYQHLSHYNLPRLVKIDEINFQEIDAAFFCLPHTASQEAISALIANGNNSHLKIFDLSADFRLENVDDYKKWYKTEHLAKDLQKLAIYGLPEIHRNKIKKSNLIACAGCYPTSALLALIPLLDSKLIKTENIIINSSSGATGAGRSAKIQNLFCEINNSVKAYSIGNHRHISEIEQELSKAARSIVEIEFTPHLIPINRGIISTIYADIKNEFSIQDIKNCLETKYQDEYFVKFTNQEPNISDVIGTNICGLSAHEGRTRNKLILVSVIDNLCKGASGQAVQNFNIAFNLDEKIGLNFSPLFP